MNHFESFMLRADDYPDWSDSDFEYDSESDADIEIGIQLPEIRALTSVGIYRDLDSRTVELIINEMTQISQCSIAAA